MNKKLNNLFPKMEGCIKGKKLFLPSISLFVILLFFLINSSYAQINGTLNITDWANATGNQLGMSGSDGELAGGLILVSVMFMMFFLPGIIFSRGKYVFEIMAFSGVFPTLLGTAFGWLDGWVLIFICMVSAFVVSLKLGGVFD